MVEKLSSINFRQKIDGFKNSLFKFKKYWILYLIFISVTALTMFNVVNYLSPIKELVGFVIIAILGIFTIVFYSYHNSDNELYKTAFVIILLFGLLCCFLNPICNVSDETEHLARADITSQGIFFPEYINSSFQVSSDIYHFFKIFRTSTIFDVEGDNVPINNTLISYPSAFQHNPFFGYLPQAIGVFIAKLFSLNVIWILWLGRICNLLCYASLISYSVKKSPIMKIPIIVMACIPVAIQQAASVSIDSMFIGLGILSISFFFYMIKSKDYTIENKEILLFSIICCLLGMTKLPFLAFILLILFVPNNKFKNNNFKQLKWACLLLTLVIGIIWTEYAMPNYLHSWRALHNVQYHVNTTQQISFMLAHPLDSIVTIFHIPNSLGDNPVLTALANVYSAVPGEAIFHKSGFITTIILMFFGAVCLFYPNTEKIELKEKIGPIIILIIVYFGVCITQIVSWATVGNLTDLIVHTRYFIPLFVFIPFIFGINNVEKKNYEIDRYIILLTVGFVSSFLIKILAVYY